MAVAIEGRVGHVRFGARIADVEEVNLHGRHRAGERRRVREDTRRQVQS